MVFFTTKFEESCQLCQESTSATVVIPFLTVPFSLIVIITMSQTPIELFSTVPFSALVFRLILIDVEYIFSSLHRDQLQSKAQARHKKNEAIFHAVVESGHGNESSTQRYAYSDYPLNLQPVKAALKSGCQ